ncbi:hypothetical protein CIB48_g7589 [Xylaria polymorpha]|nr:hypothetical protein CIB48_g7589 [Xylaria polymorpha]
MVALPLFKLGSLFVRHISKYGANRIKNQAHDHPGFRKFAAKYGQMIHQLNMRTSVALLRNVDAETKAKEKAEAPTVKTKEEIEKEDEIRAKHGATNHEIRAKKTFPITSIWRRKFRPLPEAKAKPDANLEKIAKLAERFEELERRERELEVAEKQHRDRTATLEDVLRRFNDPKTKKPLLPPPETPILATSPPAQV